MTGAASHGRSGRPWRRIREQVLARDPYCRIRGPKCTRVSTTVDHIVPLSVRPDLAHDLNNLRGACGPCNYAGGARLTNHGRGTYTPSQAQPDYVQTIRCTSTGDRWCNPACGGALQPTNCRARRAA